VGLADELRMCVESPLGSSPAAASQPLGQATIRGHRDRHPHPSSRLARRARAGLWEDRLDEPGRAVEVERAIDDGPDDPPGIDEELRGQGVDTVRAEDDPADVRPDDIFELVALGIVEAIVDRLLDLDGDEGEAAIAVALIDLAEDRRLGLAGRATTGPEVGQTARPRRSARQIRRPPGRSG
jgi:hypothetical protein